MCAYESNNKEDQFSIIISKNLIAKLWIKLGYHMDSITWNSITRPVRGINTPKVMLKSILEESRYSKALKELILV